MPYNAFDVTATEELWAWWHTLMMPPPLTPEPAKAATGSPVPGSSPEPGKRPKRSITNADARAKLIAALTKHHKYVDGGCLNFEPIGNNDLATLADVGKATASAFFDKQFDGHQKYKVACQRPETLTLSLRMLNDEFAPKLLYSQDLIAHRDDDE